MSCLEDNIKLVLDSWGCDVSDITWVNQYTKNFNDKNICVLFDFVKDNMDEIESKYKYDFVDLSIIHTSILFMPIFNHASYIKKADGEFLSISTKDSLTCFSNFFQDLVSRVPNFLDIHREINIYKYNQISRAIEECISNNIRWNNIADDWDILESVAFIRDLVVFYIFNKDINFFDVPNDVERWLSNNLQIQRYKFFSKYFK